MGHSRLFLIPLLAFAVFPPLTTAFAKDILYVTNSDAEIVSVIDGDNERLDQREGR